jgi:hypothetical protein
VREDFVLINRGRAPLELKLSVRGAGLSYRIAAYASDAPATTIGFSVIDPAHPPLTPWPGPMPVGVSTVVSTADAVVRLSIAPLSMAVLEEHASGGGQAEGRGDNAV